MVGRFARRHGITVDLGISPYGGVRAVVLTGAALAASGRLDSGILPLLTLLAMSAFVPVWEIAQVGRQLADTLGLRATAERVETPDQAARLQELGYRTAQGFLFARPMPSEEMRDLVLFSAPRVRTGARLT